MSARQANVDFLLEDLREELAIEPSPDFEHRVRRRVLDPGCERSSRRVRRADWSVVGLRGVVGLFFTATAVVVMSIIGATSWVRHASTGVPAVSATTHADATVGPIAVPTRPPSKPVAPVPQASRLIRVTSSVVSAAPGLEFELLVPPDQLDALTRLLETMRQKRMAWTPGPSVAAAAEPLLEPEPIAVPPITIEPLPALLPAPGERKQ